MPRVKGDRPLVRPVGTTNIAFVGQYCEIPDDVVFTDAIPLGATGKMQKNKLRDQFASYKLPTA